MIGGEYHVSHGRANAVLLPYVIEYNAAKPSKFVSFPKYEKFVADEKYAEIAKYLGLPAKTPEEGVKSLIHDGRHGRTCYLPGMRCGRKRIYEKTA